MPEPDDPLDGEVSLGAELKEKGFSVNAKSRAISALDRLCGSAIDVVGSSIERISKKTRAKTDGEVALIRADAEAARAKLLASGLAGDRAVATFLADQERKQLNRDAVAHEAVQELKTLPPPEKDATDPPELDVDWMNVFSTYTDSASSDRLRSLWGKILAGEVRRPGSFSLVTLRVISELDREMAEKFEKYVRPRTHDGFIPRPPGNLEGQLLHDLTFLEEVGLLQEVSGTIGKTLAELGDGFFVIPERGHLFRVKPKPNQKARVRLIPLTRVAREIARILPVEQPEVAIRAMADQLRDKMEILEIGEQVEGPQGPRFGKFKGI